jgi:hypothetical protein
MKESNRIVSWTPELLQRLDDQEFQKVVAELFRRLGYRADIVGTGGPDEGVDIIAVKSFPVHERIAIQCKRQEKAVTVEKVRQYSALYNLHDVNIVLIVTSSSFTAPAIQEAQRLKVQLWEGIKLCELLQQHMPDLLPQPQHMASSFSQTQEELITTKTQKPPNQKPTNPFIQVKESYFDVARMSLSQLERLLLKYKVELEVLNPSEERREWLVAMVQEIEYEIKRRSPSSGDGEEGEGAGRRSGIHCNWNKSAQIGSVLGVLILAAVRFKVVQEILIALLLISFYVGFYVGVYILAIRAIRAWWRKASQDSPKVEDPPQKQEEQEKQEE